MTKSDFIRKTFELAKLGKGSTWPNPLVGAIIVKDGRILATGFHHYYGGDHAEIDALKNSNESVVGATIYVNLEPCCHTKKNTPPCAQRLINEGISKVVICNLDPNPMVNGKGVELLKAHGIEVEHGILENEGEVLNEVFFLSQRKKRPFINFKSAASLDGKTALSNGESQWITGEAARKHVHEMRKEHQGIIIGAQTLRKDNPRLNVRLPDYKGPQPWRIVFTKSGQLPEKHFLFSDENCERTLIYSENELNFKFPETQFLKIKNISEAMSDLYSRKLIHLMLEGGAGLATEFFKAQLIDRVSLYQNPSFIGSGNGILGDLNLTSLNHRPRLQNIESCWLGDDHFMTGRLICSQD
jgi:diaminohydroxyphosphoribosylaminopyrimidine deaminase / 5-amino-6-(5-phosphoribosylamino)uracil reductase